MANIRTIGTGQTHSNIAAWSATIKGLGTLTDDEIGEMSVDEVDTYGAQADLDFSGVALAGFTITLRAAAGVRHDGDFGNGARIAAPVASGGLYVVKNLIMEDLSLSNTTPGSGGGRVLRTSDDVEAYRCIFTTTGGANSHIIELNGAGACVFESCRFIDGSAGISCLAANNYSIRNCTSIAVGDGYNMNVHTGQFQNNVGYLNTTDDFIGTYNGTSTNNAGSLGAIPGTSTVTLTGNPFEADGYTPLAAGQLDGAGVDLTITTDAANNPYAVPPSIGAYEVPGAGPTVPVLSNPTQPVYTP